MYSNLNIPTRKLNSYRGYAFPKTDKKEMKKILNLSIRDGKVFLFSLISFCVLSSFTSDIFYDALRRRCRHTKDTYPQLTEGSIQ